MNDTGWQYNAMADVRARAAKRAELCLESCNNDSWQILALDVLAAFVAGIDNQMFYSAHEDWLRDRKTRLSWALLLTERRGDLKFHERQLLTESWATIELNTEVLG